MQKRLWVIKMKELLETGLSLDLEYDEVSDVLAGSIGGINTVIKENNETKSYGCLMWIQKADGEEDGELDEYLSGQVAEKPHIIKHYVANGRGAALALVKYNDPKRNTRNIKEFITDLASDLKTHGYVNCCYACGNTKGLGIYESAGSVAQYCIDCRTGRLIRAMDAYAAAAPALAAERETNRVEIDSFDSVDKDSEDTSGLDDLLADVTSPEEEPEVETDRRIIGTDGETADLSGLMVSDDEEEKKPEPPRSELFEAVQREYEEEKRRNAQSSAEEDKALESLMYAGGDEEQKPETPVNAEVISAPSEADEAAIGGLMYDENDAVEEREEDAAAAVIGDDDDANIYGLMLGSEQEVAEMGADDIEVLTAAGKGADIEVVLQDTEKVGEDDTIAVTELYDDSNEGEDIDIVALDPENDRPDLVRGESIVVPDTPLEQDGSVPLINPNSNMGESSSSSGYNRNNVRAFAYGSYENANTAEEPVGFDGRPKGYRLSDPRLGDETGSRSRDYSRQQYSFNVQEEKKYKSESHVVSKSRPSSKPIPSGRTIREGSNAVVGTIAAILFGLIGCAIWCGLGYIVELMTMLDADTKDIIMAVCAFLPALFTFVGYRIGGDSFDKKGTVISAVITLILDVLGMYALLVTDVMRKAADLYGYEISLDKAIGGVSDMLSDSSAGKPAFMQIALSAVVMIIALILGIVAARKRK